MKKQFAIFAGVLICFAVVLSGCGTTGFAGARQQTVNIEVRFEGDITPDAFAGMDGASAKGKGAAALVSITTGEMSYDGTRGDIGGTKAIASDGDANAASTRTIDLPNSGGAGAVDMAGSASKDDTAAEPEIVEAESSTAPVDEKPETDK